MSSNQQGLERRGASAVADAAPTAGLITAVDDLHAQLKGALARYHVVSPVISTSALAPGYGAALSVVSIDLSEGSADVYKDNLMKGDEVALTKVSLMRISAALGISWIGTRRLDNGSRRFYWNVEVTGEYRAIDGTLQKITASREVDFTDGSAQIAGKSSAEVAQMRKHGQQLAETKAKLRGIREFGVKPKYKRHELAKPFLVCRLSFAPDMSNPEVAKLVTAAALGVVPLLYGTQPTPASEDTGDLPPELGGRQAPKQVGAGPAGATSTATSTGANAAASAPAAREEATFDDEPDADDRPRVAVLHVAPRNADGDWPIEFSDGRTLLTNERDVAKAASEAGKAGRAVVLSASNGRVDELQVVAEPAPSANAAAASAAATESGDGLRTIADVLEKGGKTNGRDWVKYTVVAEGGESWVTFSQTIANDARQAKKDGWKVRIEERQNEKYPDQMDLVSLTPIDPRQGSLIDGQAEKY